MADWGPLLHTRQNPLGLSSPPTQRHTDKHQLHVEFIPRIAKVLIIWKNAYARIALSQSMVPTAHS